VSVVAKKNVYAGPSHFDKVKPKHVPTYNSDLHIILFNSTYLSDAQTKRTWCIVVRLRWNGKVQ